MSDTGTATAGMAVGRDAAQEDEHDEDDERDRDGHRPADVADGRANRGRAILRDGELDRRRNRRLQLRDQVRTRSTVSMMLAPGSRKTMTRTAGLPLVSPPVRMFSTESVTVATSDSRSAAPFR